MQNQEKELKKELPFLIDLQKSTKKEHETSLFKGFKGIQTAIFEALDDLTSKDEVLAMGIISSKSETYNILWQNWHKQRIKKKIICKALFSDKGTEYYKAFKKMKKTQIKILKGLTPSAIDIIGNRVLIFTYTEEPSCLSINNEEIAQSFTTFFNTLWKLAKK